LTLYESTTDATRDKRDEHRVSTARRSRFLDDVSFEGTSGAAYVQELQSFAADSLAANHPLLVALANGDFRDPSRALRGFLGQYYHYSRRFTRYLAGVSAQLEAPEHRAALIGNSAEEVGRIDAEAERELRSAGIDPADAAFPHPELFQRFLRAIDVDPRNGHAHAPLLATSAWIETFHGICSQSGEAQAVGALGIATEGIVPGMYRYVLRAIGRSFPSLSKRDRVFFDLHATVDDEHAEVLRDIAAALAATAGERRALALGTLRALQARETFFGELYGHLRAVDLDLQPGQAP